MNNFVPVPYSDSMKNNENNNNNNMLTSNAHCLFPATLHLTFWEILTGTRKHVKDGQEFIWNIDLNSVVNCDALIILVK